MPQNTVFVTDLTRKFGDFIAVNKINFSVNEGEIFGFLGANGAGKTTTIRMLIGLLKPSSGTAFVNGYNVLNEANKIKASIGYMSQKFSLYTDLTVKENIEFYGGIYGLKRKEIKNKIEDLLNYLNIHEYKNKLVKELSLGWKQKLALCVAIIHDPKIIFLDEPTSGVDPISRRDFWQLIYELSAKGKTIFVTTHNMDESEYCHRVSIMKDGNIIALDAPQILKNKFAAKTMQDLFIKLTLDKTS